MDENVIMKSIILYAHLRKKKDSEDLGGVGRGEKYDKIHFMKKKNFKKRLWLFHNSIYGYPTISLSFYRWYILGLFPI